MQLLVDSVLSCLCLRTYVMLLEGAADQRKITRGQLPQVYRGRIIRCQEEGP